MKKLLISGIVGIFFLIGWKSEEKTITNDKFWRGYNVVVQ